MKGKKSIRLKASERNFYEGVNCALAVIVSHDQPTIWYDIALNCGGYALLRKVSADAGNLESDGFNQYKDPALAWKPKEKSVTP